MKSFKYMGKYVSEDELPKREHPEGYVPYKEPQNMKKLALVVNTISMVITLAMIFLFFVRIHYAKEIDLFDILIKFLFGSVLSILTFLPHELLHGVAMNGEVKMYQNLKQGMLFVISIDDVSKGQFIFMSLLPNIVFGFIPFIIFLIFPNLVALGALGALAIGAGAGDYLNVYNTIKQVPKGAKVYMSGMHSYWYK